MLHAFLLVNRCVGLDVQRLNLSTNKFSVIRANTFRSKSDSDFEENQKYAVVLANLVVRVDRRKQGLAKVLMEACENTVKEWGFDEIYLQVDSKNVAAQKLYKKLGESCIPFV